MQYNYFKTLACCRVHDAIRADADGIFVYCWESLTIGQYLILLNRCDE